MEELDLESQENLQNHPKYEYQTRKSSKCFSYNDFFWDFMVPNELVIFSNVSNDWPCRRDWIDGDKVNFNWLEDKFKSLTVPVADNSQAFYNSHLKLDMVFSDYIDYWRTKEDTRKQLLYLKDWHLKAALPEYNFYKVPKYFASDWLNEYLLDHKLDDYRFVYMGPKGSWTPFHSDVFSSFSWSTNIVGQKKWVFLPPGEEQKLKDSLNNFPFRLDEETLKTENIKHYTIIQNENESIFVPSNWYHELQYPPYLEKPHSELEECGEGDRRLQGYEQLRGALSEDVEG
ncbi:JMJD4 family protein [Megaselia abdita]